MNKYKIDPKHDLHSFRKTLGFVWESSRALTLTSLTLVFFQSVLPLIPLYLIKLLIDHIAQDKSHSFSGIWWILILFGVVQLVLIAMENISQYVMKIQADKVSDHMSLLVLNKSIDIDLEHYDSDRYHDTYHRAQLQAGHRPTALLNALTQLAQNALLLLALSGLLATLNWGLGLVLLVMVIPIAWIQLKYTKIMFRWKEKTTALERKSNYLRVVLSTVTYAKELPLFSYGKLILERFASIRARLLNEKRELYKGQNIRLSLVQMIEAIGTIGVLVFIVSRAIGGSITIGDIVMYFQAFQKGQSTIHGLLRSGVSLYENKLFLTHIFRFLDLDSSIKDPQHPVNMSPSVEEIVLEDVSFVYPGNSDPVLKSVNLTFRKGQINALVGENGSGKTTLVKLLNRLYDPTKGQISLNGHDIRSYRVDDLRKQFSVIFQDFSKYDFSVAENISIADIHREKNESSLVESARLTGADQFIDRLEHGYDSQLGRSFSKGHELSGGQWQKIALARAFYKQAGVIVLDEPTSFIDPLAEAEIFANLKAIGFEKIVVLVTHRIYNLRLADQIIVLDKGMIIETGNHKELMANNGKYARMFESQM